MVVWGVWRFQERNEQEGKVAAIKSLQQWRLTDVELHNFINRCVGTVCVRPAAGSVTSVSAMGTVQVLAMAATFYFCALFLCFCVHGSVCLSIGLFCLSSFEWVYSAFVSTTATVLLLRVD